MKVNDLIGELNKSSLDADVSIFTEYIERQIAGVKWDQKNNKMYIVIDNQV